MHPVPPPYPSRISPIGPTNANHLAWGPGGLHGPQRPPRGDPGPRPSRGTRTLPEPRDEAIKLGLGKNSAEQFGAGVPGKGPGGSTKEGGIGLNSAGLSSVGLCGICWGASLGRAGTGWAEENTGPPPGPGYPQKKNTSAKTRPDQNTKKTPPPDGKH
jgi:hypothetical protein